MNGKTESSQSVSLDGNSERSVSFSFSPDAPGTYTVTFKIDGATVSVQEVNLAPRSHQSVEYITSGTSPGARLVDVNGEKAKFTVRPLAEPPRAAADIDWYLIGLLIFAATAVSSFIGFRIRARAKYIPPVARSARRRL